jgi:hypothetical protein
MTDIVQSPFNKARVDKFTMVINLPPALKSINSKFTRSNKNVNIDALQFSVFGTVIPDIVVPAVETRFGGSTIYVSSHSRPSFPPVTINFTIDNEFNNYWCIYQWLNLMRDEREGVFGVVNSRGLANAEAVLNEYATTFTLYAKDEFNNNIIKFEYLKAFPTKLGSISLTYQDSKEIQCSFEFVFSNIISTIL